MNNERINLTYMISQLRDNFYAAGHNRLDTIWHLMSRDIRTLGDRGYQMVELESPLMIGGILVKYAILPPNAQGTLLGFEVYESRLYARIEVDQDKFNNISVWGAATTLEAVEQVLKSTEVYTEHLTSYVERKG